MRYDYFIGADISKPFIDFVVLDQNGEKLFYLQVENTRTDLTRFVKDLSKKYTLSNCLFCMENTGIYNEHLLHTLYKRHANIWLEKAIQIKQSLGLQRGKNDQVDAFRVALYAYKHQKDVCLWEPERTVISELRRYTSLRSRLIGIVVTLSNPLQELEQFTKKQEYNALKRHCQSSLNALKSDIKKVEARIDKLIVEDPYLDKLFNLVTSVDGVGKVVAQEFIIATGEFKRITDPKKFACYSGVVPFEHSSGISIRGKTRVSPLANKRMKKLLHLSALINVQLEGDLQTYYHKKVAEGKKDRKSTRLNSSHPSRSRMPSSA